MKAIYISILLISVLAISSCFKRKEVDIISSQTEIFSTDTIICKAKANFRVKHYEWWLDEFNLISTTKEAYVRFHSQGAHTLELRAITNSGKTKTTKKEFIVKPSAGTIKSWFNSPAIYPLFYYYDVSLSATGTTYDGVAYKDSVYLDSMSSNSDYSLNCSSLRLPYLALNLPGGTYYCQFKARKKSGFENLNYRSIIKIDGGCYSVGP